MNSYFIPMSAETGNLIDLPLLAHLHGHYVLDKHFLNFQQTFFFPWSTKAPQNLPIKYLYKGLSISNREGDCIEEREETPLNRNITIYYNVAPASKLSCGYLNSQRNHIQGSTIRPISSVNNLVKLIWGLLLIHTNHHPDAIFLGSFLFTI